MPGLTAKQKAFVLGYASHGNGAKAARDAGYAVKDAAVAAAKLLRSKPILEELDRLTKSPGRKKVIESSLISKERVLTEINHLAFLDPGQFFNEDGSLKAVHDMPEEARRALTGLKDGKYGREIRFADKIPALRMLSEHLGITSSQTMIAQGLQINIHLDGVKQPAIDVTEEP